MNTATRDLENDHIHILHLTDVMEKITRTESPVADDLDTVVWLIRHYADRFHHGKEEQILFPALESKGFSPHQGPVAVMLAEHVQGRNYVKGIEENIIPYRNGSKSALKIICDNMRGYVDLLRNHIAKENNILFRMADKVLSDDDHASLLERYSSVKPATKSGGITEYLSAIENLNVKY